MAAAKDTQAQIENPAETGREEITVTVRLNDFIQKYRKGILSGLAALIVVVAGTAAGFAVREKMQARALTTVDGFERSYEALRIFMGSEDPGAADKQAEINTLLADLDAFARKNSGFAAARAYTLSAGIYDAQKKWAEAETLWLAAAEAAAKTYLAPVCLFNAAVAAEEQGNTDNAIGLYTRALGYDTSFPAAARAQFSVGRLQESASNREAAIEAYRNLVSKWPGDPVWVNLAQSRLLVLSD